MGEEKRVRGKSVGEKWKKRERKKRRKRRLPINVFGYATGLLLLLLLLLLIMTTTMYISWPVRKYVLFD